LAQQQEQTMKQKDWWQQQLTIAEEQMIEQKVDGSNHQVTKNLEGRLALWEERSVHLLKVDQKEQFVLRASTAVWLNFLMG